MTSGSRKDGTPIALACQGLTKQFGGLKAVNDVNLQVAQGERRAIIGPNGAGKTTFFSLINGLLPATAGSVSIFGKDISRSASYERTALGLSRTFQITNLFPTMTVIENLVIAVMGLKSMKFSMLKPLTTYASLYEQGCDMLEKMGLADQQNEIIKNLSYGEQRQVEIAMALVSNPKVLLLDEPTAGLSAADSDAIVKLIKNLDPLITILIIEHNMDVALEVADYISVLHQGSIFAEGGTSDIRNNPSVQEIYFGTED
jgi:branched-chain amino acid transport system ATP-binding protein